MSIALGVLLQIAVSVQVSDTISARTPVPMIVRATVPGNTAPRMTVPTATGASLQLMSDVTRLGGGFGQAVATRELRYVLRVPGAGAVVISPIVATLGAQQTISIAKRIVVQPPPTNSVPAIVTRAPISRRTTVNFQSLVTQDTVWTGEQVTLQVAVFIDDELRSRLVRNPEYVAPAVDGAVAYDLPVANDALPSREVDGARYRPFVFARALFPLRAGTLQIPAARLGFTLGSPGTMFGRSERQTAVTSSHSVVVRELPTEGRPARFTGAVGVYSITAALDHDAGRVGDAVQLAVRVLGAGNVKLLPAPDINIPGVTSSPSGESIDVDSTDLLVRGSKTFRFLLTPTRTGEIPLGEVRYVYFNPLRGTYEEATAPLGALRVAAGAAVIADEATASAPAIPLQPWRQDAAHDITDAWWYRTLVLALGAPWLLLMSRRLWRLLPRRPSRERRAQRRTAASDTPVVDAATLRRQLLARLGPLVQLRTSDPFAVPEVVMRLRRAGVTAGAAEAAGALLVRLDRLTFGSAASAPDGMLQSLRSEADAVVAQLNDELSSTAKRRIATAARSIALLAGLARTLSAQPADFARGIDLYRRAQFTEAASAFARSAMLAPQNASVWANLGAAHWMRADTAGAIVAWQRSVRIQPRGNPASKLLNANSPSFDLQTAIVPVEPNVAWLVLLGVTGALSIAGAAWRWSGRRVSNRALLLAAGVISGCAGLAFLAERSANAEGVVVVRRAAALRLEPVLAGEARARARAGELAMVGDTTARWLRITLADGRAGWVEADALRSLAVGDARDVAAAESGVAADVPSP